MGAKGAVEDWVGSGTFGGGRRLASCALRAEEKMDTGPGKR